MLRQLCVIVQKDQLSEVFIIEKAVVALVL